MDKNTQAETVEQEQEGAELTEEEQALEDLARVTKRGFDLKERLKKRGLRKATVTLYLDEELGAELGWDRPVANALGEEVDRDRHGVLGQIADLEDQAAALTEERDGMEIETPERLSLDVSIESLQAKIADLEVQRDNLARKLQETGLTVSLRAVPPVIAKDCHRKARLTIGVTEKNIPQDRMEEYAFAHTAHLLSVMAQSIVDNQTGDANDGIDYEDAVSLRDLLPISQWLVIDNIMGKLQYTDAISKTLEAQEDFS